MEDQSVISGYFSDSFENHCIPLCYAVKHQWNMFPHKFHTKSLQEDWRLRMWTESSLSVELQLAASI